MLGISSVAYFNENKKFISISYKLTDTRSISHNCFFFFNSVFHGIEAMMKLTSGGGSCTSL